MTNYSGRKIKTPAAYTLTHQPTGRFYIGSSSDVHARLSRHKHSMKDGNHPNGGLREVGATWDDIAVEIFPCSSSEEAEKMELDALDKHLGGKLCCNVIPDNIGPRNEHKEVSVVIDGTPYPSIAEAARALDVTHKVMSKRLSTKSGLYKDWQKL